MRRREKKERDRMIRMRDERRGRGEERGGPLGFVHMCAGARASVCGSFGAVVAVRLLGVCWCGPWSSQRWSECVGVSVGWQVSQRFGLFVYDSATSEPTIARANPLWILRGWSGDWCVSGGAGGAGGAVTAAPCRRRIRVVCWSGALTGPCALLPKMLIKEL